MRWPLVVVLSLVACGSSKEPAGKAGSATPPAARPQGTGGGTTAAPAAPGKGTMRTYSLDADGDAVAVEISIPAGWTEDAMSTPTAPAWSVPGARMLSLVAISPRGDDATKVAKAIKMQYGDAAGAERTDLPDGRVWMVRAEGENLHARMFVPFADGVVMGVVMMDPDDAGRLPEIKQAFESIKIPAAPAP